MDNKEKFFHRDLYINYLKPFMGKQVIKVLTGQRRVGKSFLLRTIRDDFKRNQSSLPILEFSSENEDQLFIRDSDSFLRWVNAQAPDRSPLVLLADEVQELAGFEQALQTLLARGNCDIYCTGSNARFLSADILGRLSGRAVEVRVHPLNYSEFLEFHGRTDSDDSLALYLRFGGMPFLHNLPLEEGAVFEYLKSIYNTILYKDVIKRKGVRNIDLLERLVRYAADNTGSIVSAKKIADFLKSQRNAAAVGSILEYLDHLTEACFLNRVRRSDLAGKRIFEIGEKFYFSDLGLRHSVAPLRQADLGKVLENVVHNHLAAHGWTVSTGWDGVREIDFIAEKANEKAYFQVSLSLSDETTIEREFGNLLAVSDAWPRYVVTLDPYAVGQDGIRCLLAREFLMKGEAW